MPIKKKKPAENEVTSEMNISEPVAPPKRQRTQKSPGASTRRKAPVQKPIEAGVPAEAAANTAPVVETTPFAEITPPREATPLPDQTPPAEATPPPIAHTETQPPQENVFKTGLTEEDQIALLAYSFWEDRGRQGGSAEDDWYRAEKIIRHDRQHVVKAS